MKNEKARKIVLQPIENYSVAQRDFLFPESKTLVSVPARY